MPNIFAVIPANPNHFERIKELLLAENLPVDDIPEDLKNFLIVLDSRVVIGCIGLEIYGQYGLLRSLVVKPEYRGKNISGELVKKLELVAGENGINEIYLLTETAESYFERRGYAIIDRAAVPDPVRSSPEFSHLCPASATVMKKNILL